MLMLRSSSVNGNGGSEVTGTGQEGVHGGEEQLPMERVASLSRLDVRGARLSCLRGSALLQDGLMMVQENFVPAWALLPLLVGPARPVEELRLGWSGETADSLSDTGIRMWFPEEPDAADSEKAGGKSLGNALAEALRDHVSAGPP